MTSEELKQFISQQIPDAVFEESQFLNVIVDGAKAFPLLKSLRENHETEFVTEFLMCNGCFWCACFYGEKNKMFEACPICNAHLESIPILNNEQFKISHTLKAGFSLEFQMKK